MTTRPRARDLAPNLFAGLPPGPHNAITDVPGVRVGHTTLIEGEGKWVQGEGPIRTGVTAILPNAGDVFMDRVVGGGFVLNGAGEVAGFTQLVEWGLLESPILLTNTLSVGACTDAIVSNLVAKYPQIGRKLDVVIPVVGECDDSWLNDIAGRHVTAEHVEQALRTARGGPVAEGNVGGGTGMITCDYAGGIGTSSRRVSEAHGGYTIGVLVMSNFGVRSELRFAGIPIGRVLEREKVEEDRRQENYGSIIAVIATDAPLMPHQLGRIAKRAALGVGRVGSHAGHGSGEIMVAFSTANTVHRDDDARTYKVEVLADQFISPLYKATIDATEEAILNALCGATDKTGIHSRKIPALPVERVRSLLGTALGGEFA